MLCFLSEVKYAASPGQLSFGKYLEIPWEMLDQGIKQSVLAKVKYGSFCPRMKVLKKNSDGAGSDTDVEQLKQVCSSISIWTYNNILDMVNSKQ